MEAPDNLREELHGILRAADRVRAPKPDQGFLEEFLMRGASAENHCLERV